MYAASSLASNVRRKPLLVFFCDFWIAELARNFRDRTGNPVLLHLPKEVLRTLEVLHNQCARRVSIPQVTAYLFPPPDRLEVLPKRVRKQAKLARVGREPDPRMLLCPAGMAQLEIRDQGSDLAV